MSRKVLGGPQEGLQSVVFHRQLLLTQAPSIKSMKSTQDIVDSIDTRLRELGEEINTLNAARSALETSEHEPSIRPSRRTTTRRARPAGELPRTRASAASRHETSPEVAQEPPARSREPTPKSARRTARRASPTPSGDRLEALLIESGGVTTAELAERASGNRDQVLTLLRDLERAGRVRRTGQRRGTRWHAITDDDRIRQRIAELEASRRRPA
jgi:hypothetical protein